jgi:hypothetical protein
VCQSCCITKETQNIKISFRGKQHIGKAKENKMLKKGYVLSLPDYLNVPDRTFKGIFMAASKHIITANQYDIIRRSLDNSTNM